MAKKPVKKIEGIEEVEVAEEAIEEVEVKAVEKDITIDLPVMIRINGEKFGPGQIKVKPAVARDLLYMASKKLKSDLRVHTGKNFMVERLVNGSLVVKETRE